jgi:hypothetical protein
MTNVTRATGALLRATHRFTHPPLVARAGEERWIDAQ